MPSIKKKFSSKKRGRKHRGGILIQGNSYDALHDALKTGSFHKLGNEESLSGIIIKVNLPTSSKSFISTNTNTMGQPVKSLLLKIVFIRPSKGEIKLDYQLRTYNGPTLINKESVNKKMFIDEVAIQHDVYMKTNYFGDPLCPSIVGTYILKMDDHIVQTLSTSIKDIQSIIEKISGFDRADSYRVGIIAMELLDNYMTLSDSFINFDQELVFPSDQCRMVSAMYAFLRLSCLGYKHNDLHRYNIMVNPFDNTFAGYSTIPNATTLSSGRAFIIDFGNATQMDDEHKDIVVGEYVNRYGTKVSGFKDFYNNFIHTIQEKGERGENFFTKIGYTYDDDFWFKWTSSSFFNNIHGYTNNRHKILMNRINSGLFTDDTGIIPMNYSNIKGDIHGFSGIISDDDTDIELFEQEYNKYKQIPGVDLDVALVLQDPTSKQTTIRELINSSMYNQMKSRTEVTPVLRDIIDAYKQGTPYQPKSAVQKTRTIDEKPKADTKQSSPLKKPLTPSRRIDERLFNVSSTNANANVPFEEALGQSIQEIQKMCPTNYVDLDYLLKKRSAILKMFRDVFDTPAGRRRVQQDASIRTMLQTQLKNTIDFANRSSNLLDNTEFKAYIEDLLRRVNEYESQQKSKIESRRTKKSSSQIQSHRSRSKSRIDK
jgi:hypothetical protein